MTEQGQLIAGRYRIEERIGSGAMGVVWRGVDELLHRTVAVKQLLIQSDVDNAEDAATAAQRAMREGRIAARLQHPHAVTVYDVAEHDSQPWLVMEYVSCRSLAEVLHSDGRLAPGRVAGIGAQLASALAAAHAVGVVHRDVKPGNVLLTDDGIAKITDFGISRAADDVVLTKTGLLSGTPAYLAPEVASGAPPSPPSDVFALGATLYAAVEGEPPFGFGENTLALLHKVAAGKVRPPAMAGPLAPVLTQLLRADPDARPSMGAARAALAAVAADPTARAAAEALTTTIPPAPPTPTSTAAPLPPKPPQPKPRRYRGLLISGLIAVAAIALGMLGYRIVQGMDHPTHHAGSGVLPTRQAGLPATNPGAVGNGQPIGLDEMRAKLTNYYALLPGNTTAAFAELTQYDQLRSGGRAGYDTFYAAIASVGVGDFAAESPGEVDATVTFVRTTGVTTHERYRFFFVRRDGQLLISDAVRLGNA